VVAPTVQARQRPDGTLRGGGAPIVRTQRRLNPPLQDSADISWLVLVASGAVQLRRDIQIGADEPDYLAPLA
jgi:hypothetical protein